MAHRTALVRAEALVPRTVRETHLCLEREGHVTTPRMVSHLASADLKGSASHPLAGGGGVVEREGGAEIGTGTYFDGGLR